MRWRQVFFVSCGTLLFLFGLSLGAPLHKKESLDNIESLKAKLEDLKTVLRGLDSEFAVKDVAEPAQDNNLQQFESQLSEADQALLEKMNSKVKYLQEALAKPVHPDEADQESVGQAKRENDELRDLFARLSPQDVKLIQAHASKLNALKEALYSKGLSDVKQTKQTSDTAKEVEILEAIKAKLTELKSSMARDEKCKNDPLCDDPPHAEVTEGKFVDVQKGLHSDGTWMNAPLIDTASVTVTEKCKDGENCHKPKDDHDQMVNSAKEQLLTDLANAKKNGISTKELLDALAAKRGI